MSESFTLDSSRCELLMTTEVKREKWKNYRQYVLTLLATVIGLSNIYKTPYRCLEGGGGSYFIIYSICNVLIAAPMVYLELALGQYTNADNIMLFYRLGRAWMGLGIVQCILSFVTLSYYSYMQAITMRLMIVSLTFNNSLPWEICRKEHGPMCVSNLNMTQTMDYKDSSSFFYVWIDLLQVHLKNETTNEKIKNCLMGVWLIMFIVTSGGLRFFAYCSHFLLLFTYTMLIPFTIWCASQPGAGIGIVYLFNIDIALLFNIKYWMWAVGHILFVYGCGYGLLSLHSSHNEQNYPIGKTVIIVVVVNYVTDLLGLILVYSVIGQIAHMKKVPVTGVVRDQMADVMFSHSMDSVSFLQWKHRYLVGILMFAMMTTMGLSRTSSMLLVIRDNFMDLCPIIKRYQASILWVSLLFWTSVIYTSSAGNEGFLLMNKYGSAHNSMILIVLQLYAVCYTYGLQLWCWDLEFLNGKKVNYILRWSWAVVLPIFISSSVIFSTVSMTQDIMQATKDGNFLTTVMLSLQMVGVTCPVWLCKLYFFFKYRKGFTTGLEAMYESTFMNENPVIGFKALRFRRLKFLSYDYFEESSFKMFIMALVRKL